MPGHRLAGGRAALSMNKRIKQRRLAREWSQSDLAAALTVSRQTVTAIENGRYDPSLPLASTIAAMFERRIEDIFQP